LQDKYKWKPEDAKAMASFILPMLEYNIEKRASAAKMLEHEWIRDVPPQLPIRSSLSLDKKSMDHLSRPFKSASQTFAHEEKKHEEKERRTLSQILHLSTGRKSSTSVHRPEKHPEEKKIEDAPRSVH
jgi:serine/threonine protein kinase